MQGMGKTHLFWLQWPSSAHMKPRQNVVFALLCIFYIFCYAHALQPVCFPVIDAYFSCNYINMEVDVFYTLVIYLLFICLRLLGGYLVLGCWKMGKKELPGLMTSRRNVVIIWRIKRHNNNFLAKKQVFFKNPGHGSVARHTTRIFWKWVVPAVDINIRAGFCLRVHIYEGIWMGCVPA